MNRATPGPFSTGDSQHTVGGGWSVAIYAHEGNQCVGEAYGETREEAEANARLFCGAPMLFDALNDIAMHPSLSSKQVAMNLTAIETVRGNL